VSIPNGSDGPFQGQALGRGSQGRQASRYLEASLSAGFGRAISAKLTVTGEIYSLPKQLRLVELISAVWARDAHDLCGTSLSQKYSRFSR
jgi:hypothetical protein